MADTFTVKLKYKSEDEHLIMIKLLYSLTIHLSALESMFLSVYSKTYNQKAEEVKKIYDDLIEKSANEWNLSLSKYCDLDIQKH
jgi:hypothetical protein